MNSHLTESKFRIFVMLATLFLGNHLGAAGEAPLVYFNFDQGLQNWGTLGGAGQFKVYAPDEDAGYDAGPFGKCLDLTAASRHGGTSAKDAPAGGTVMFRSKALDSIDTFTVMVWSRQNSLVHGTTARLITKENSWEIMPHPWGMVVALGAGDGKAAYEFNGKKARNSENQWEFTAVVVGPETLRVYVGSWGQALTLIGEKPRQGHRGTGRGDLLLGTFGGIRPFNGWLDRLRIFGQALNEKKIREIFDADQADAKQSGTAQWSQRLIYDLARPAAGTHRFSLKRSDIPFSTRWQNNANAPATMESFHATQCLWVYGAKTNFIQQIKARGIGYQGTLNGLQGDECSTTNRSAAGDLSGRQENLDGNKITPAWMATWGPRNFVGCCNHPAFRQLFFAAARQQIVAGVDMLHVDDWEMNSAFSRNGEGCFCEHCRAGFREWLKQHCAREELAHLDITDLSRFDYRDYLKRHGVPDAAAYKLVFRTQPLTPQFLAFQTESIHSFYREWRRQLNEGSPNKYIPVSVNALLIHSFPNNEFCGVDVVDFYTGEASQNPDYQTEAEFIFAAKTAEAVGISQVVSPIPISTARTRAAIATSYALGQTHLVPWDLYAGNTPSGSTLPRYFGTLEQYGDCYNFIHEHKSLFDDYESAAEVGVLVNADVAAERGSLPLFCQNLARLQIPFHLIIGASQYARVPIRAADLRALRILVEFSPLNSFSREDQDQIKASRESGMLRLLSPAADLESLIRGRKMDLLRVEAPRGVYAFPRVNRSHHSTAIHLVNWNLRSNGDRAECYQNVNLTLLQPQRWGKLASATYLQPGQKPLPLAIEIHDDCLRLSLPQIETWGVVEITGQN